MTTKRELIAFLEFTVAALKKDECNVGDIHIDYADVLKEVGEENGYRRMRDTGEKHYTIKFTTGKQSYE